MNIRATLKIIQVSGAKRYCESFAFMPKTITVHCTCFAFVTLPMVVSPFVLVMQP